MRDAITRRRDGLHDLALAEPRDAGRPPGGEPQRAVGRGAAAGGRDGRAERRPLRDRRRRRGPQRRRSGRARVAHAAARSRGRVRAGRSPSASSAGAASPGTWKKYLDLLDETAAMGGRMFAQAHSRSLSRAALVQDADAVRPPAGVEGHPQAAARGAAAEAARSRAAPQAHRGVGRARRAPGARHRGAAGRLRLAARVRHRGRAAPLGGARSRASATSIRPRP